MDNLQELMNTAMAEIKDSGIIKETVKKQLNDTVSHIVKDMFNYYSDFGKKLKEEIKSQLQIDLSNLGIGGYSSTITTMIRQIIKEKIENDAAKEVERFLADIEDHDIKPEMKITEIVEKITEMWKENDFDLKSDGGVFSFHFIQRWPGDRTLKHCYNIYIDKEEGKEPHECEITLDYNNERQEIDDISIQSKSMKENIFYTTRRWNIEGFLFRLYSAKPTVTNDADQVEIDIYGENDY
jgi:BMFP domain-containing protein YqiC